MQPEVQNQVVDARDIACALRRADRLLTHALIAGMATTGHHFDNLVNLQKRLGAEDRSVKDAIQAFITAARRVRIAVELTWQEASDNARNAAWNFLSEHTNQSFPGLVTLPGQQGLETLDVVGVREFQFHPDSTSWTVTVEIQEPKKLSMRKIYSTGTGEVGWAPID